MGWDEKKGRARGRISFTKFSTINKDKLYAFHHRLTNYNQVVNNSIRRHNKIPVTRSLPLTPLITCSLKNIYYDGTKGKWGVKNT